MKTKFTPLVIFIPLAIFLLPLVINDLFMPLELNQFILETLPEQYNLHDSVRQGNHLLSSYSSGMNIIINRPNKTPPPLDDYNAYVDYIFSWLPYEIFVYPTEGFYYYSFPHPTEGFIGGNMRLADAKRGQFSIAYFQIGENVNISERQVEVVEGIFLDSKEIGPSVYEITHNGKTILVHLPLKYAKTPPKKTPLLPEEEFIGRLQDESGVRFFVIYNNKTSSFYFILNEEEPVLEKFEALDNSLLLGKRTGFIFYNDPILERKLFVGAYEPNIEENNFLDGPGDQVPYGIDIREKLQRAYPNTMLGDGIDEYGVYYNRTQWVRIAVTPFERYSFISDIEEKLAKCTNSETSAFYTCATKEWWNTPFWREKIIEKVESEGKVYPWK